MTYLRPLLLFATFVSVAPLAWAQAPEPEASPTEEEGASAGERKAGEQYRLSLNAESDATAKALDEATALLSSAEGSAAAAQKELQQAIAAVDSADARVVTAQAALDLSTAAAEEAEAAATAEGATDEQKQAAVAAKAQLEGATRELADVQAAAEQAALARDQAQEAADTAAEAVEEAGEKVAAATKAEAQARDKQSAAAAARAAMERVANTPRGPDMSLDELRLRLKPLTDVELVVEADAWIGVLKAFATGISYADIASRTAEGKEREVILEALTTLRDDRTDTIDRLDLVLAELERKGGDTAKYERYKSAISGLDYNPKDISATYAAISGWLLSEKGGIRWGLNLLFFVLVLVAFRMIGSVAGKVMGRALASSKVKTSSLLNDFFVNVTRKAIGFLGIVIALSMLEINVTPFLAAMGGGALVVGLALQGTLGNFAAGVMILMYRPYDIGHVVKVAGVTGTVDAMSLVATTLRSPDNQLVVVPNGSIWGGIITNITGTERRRVDLVFGIGYDDDMAKAEAVLKELTAAHPKVLEDPAVVIKVHELGDSAVNIICRPWCKSADYWDVYWDLTRQVKERFDAEEISFPYPQSDVHMHQAVASASSE